MRDIKRPTYEEGIAKRRPAPYNGKEYTDEELKLHEEQQKQLEEDQGNALAIEQEEREPTEEDYERMSKKLEEVQITEEAREYWLQWEYKYRRIHGNPDA